MTGGSRCVWMCVPFRTFDRHIELDGPHTTGRMRRVVRSGAAAVIWTCILHARCSAEMSSGTAASTRRAVVAGTGCAGAGGQAHLPSARHFAVAAGHTVGQQGHPASSGQRPSIHRADVRRARGGVWWDSGRVVGMPDARRLRGTDTATVNVGARETLLDDFDRLGGQTRAPDCKRQVAPDASASTSRGAASPEPQPQGQRWLLLRHGQTNFNAEGRVQGSSDTARLTEEGRQQARAVGLFLAALEIGKVFVSPLGRAQETLQEAEKAMGDHRSVAQHQLVPGLEPKSTRVLNDLREVDLHEWEGLLKQEIKRQWPHLYHTWRGDSPEEFRLLSGRYPIRDLWARAASVWAHVLSDASAGQAQARGRGTLLVGHNGINQALLATAVGLPADAFRFFEFPNCGIAEVVWNPGEATARQWRWVYGGGAGDAPAGGYPAPSPWKTAEQTRLEWEQAAAKANWDLRGARSVPTKAHGGQCGCRIWTQQRNPVVHCAA